MNFHFRLVHISKETYNHLTEQDYLIKPGNGGIRDPFLKEKNIETYLISPKLEPSNTANDLG